MATKNPQALLQRLLKEPAESTWVEFKQNNSDPQIIGKWISACANSAILSGKDRAFLVYGIEDQTKNPVGTKIRLRELKKGNEGFINWIDRKIQPQLAMEFLDFEYDNKPFSILVVEPTYHKPVEFDGVRYIRMGEHIKELSSHPEYERAIWLATSRRKFEDAIAAPHETAEQVLEKLDADVYYNLNQKEGKPGSTEEIMKRFHQRGFIIDDMEGGYDITNLGAILLARNIERFPSIATKSVRIIKYAGTDKMHSRGEIEGKKGYAVGFSGLMKYVMEALPSEEKYIDGIRTMVPVYPEIAIREVIANALIHQDFTISGAGPVIEIYSDRIEVTNPGNSLIEVDRIIDDRRSRNEKLASVARGLHLCEERGGGLDKTMIAIEIEKNLPAPDIHSSENSMRVVLFGPRPFNHLSKDDKQRACFYHCVLRWMKKDFMSNTSLRDRFSLSQDDYQAVSAIISEAVKSGRIIPADKNQGNRNAKYVPYWAK
jgi:ATP-dependent DNA helicase RecG